MLNWETGYTDDSGNVGKVFSPITHKQKLHAEIRLMFNEDSYYKTWTMTDIIRDSDERSNVILQVLEGAGADGNRYLERAVVVRYKFNVLTRQACVRTKKGQRIFDNPNAKITHGAPDDIVAEFTDAAEPGDIVEWKGPRITHDPATGKPVDGTLLKAWARQGKRPNEYIKYEVDNDGCITVLYPYAKSMLEKHGKGLAKAQFRKIDIRDKTRRKLTNWWFEEVAPDYKKPRKQRSDAGTTKAPTEPVTEPASA